MLKRRMEDIERGQIDSITPVKANKISSSITLNSNESLETDADGTKVLVRKFDMPLPVKHFMQPAILRTPLSFCAPREKWKYQHDVPDGKIVTKLVHMEPNSNNNNNNFNSSVKPELSISNSLPSKLSIKTHQSEPVRQYQNKGYLVVKPNEQTSKVFAPVTKTKSAEKITVNNLPENVIPNSIKVVDSKIVNGRKVFYLKAFKEVGKVVSKSLENGSSEAASSQSSVEQKKSDNQVIKLVSGSGTVTSSLVCVNSCEPKTMLSVITPPKTNMELKKNDAHVHNPANVSGSGMIPLLNVASGDPKILLTVAKPPQISTDVRKIDAILRKPFSVVRSSAIPQLNVSSCDGRAVPTAMSAPCDAGENKKDGQVIVNPVVASGVIPISNLKYLTRPVPATSMLSQNNKDAKQNDTSVISPFNLMNSGRNIFTKNVITSKGSEITLQLGDTTTTLQGTILNSNTSKQNIKITENNEDGVCHEITSAICDDLSLPDEHVLNVDEQMSEDNYLKLVPADSTTPFITNAVVSTVPSEVRIPNHRENNKNPTEVMVDVNERPSSINYTESILTVNNKHSSANENVLIVNKAQKCSSDSSTVVIPKQKPKFDDMMRRRKIALQYQRDVHKSRELPRMERVVELAARNVKLVDISTQTSLFSMLEPGRIVEMLVTEDSKGEHVVEPTKNKNTGTTTMHTKSQSIGETTGSSNVSDDFLKHTGNDRTTTTELMDAPVPKRMRLDLSNSTSEINREDCQDIQNENSILSANMDVSDFEKSHFPTLEKENFLQLQNVSTRPSKGNENGIRNVNSLSPLACMQSAMNSSAKFNEINVMSCSSLHNNEIGILVNREMRQRVYKDFRESLLADNDGNLPIHNAVMDRDLKEVQRQCLVLIAQKRNVDVKNSMKETPLHLAVLCHDVEIVNLLLKFKAKPDVPDGEGNTTLHMAIKWSDDKILDTLLNSVEDNSPALNVPNDEGYSLMHLCSIHNKCYEALLLVKKNADINIRDRKSGRTPLFHAVERGNTEMSRLLVNSGASTTISNFSGQTPLNASEVTLVLDKIHEHTDISKQIVAPCSCRTDESVDNEQTMSHSETCEGEQRSTVIEDVCASDVEMCEEETDLSLKLLNCNFVQAFNDR